MLRIIHAGNTMPLSYPVDPSATFQPGQIGQLKVMGNNIMCGVSDGTAPFGIIDDVASSAFTSPSKDEVVTIPCVAVSDGYQLVAAIDTKGELRFPSVIRSSFIADVEGLILNEINGIITVQAGTALNFDSDGDGILDSLRTVVNYQYRIANIPGDNSTIGSGQITLWYGRFVLETNMYDTTQRYIVNATLFVNSEGMLTTKQESANCPGVAMVTGPPSGIVETLEALWF